MLNAGLRRSFLSSLAILLVGLGSIALYLGPVRVETDEGHHLSVELDEAVNVVDGQEVKAGGRKIGRVADVAAADGGRRAKVTLRIDDDAWPIPRGSRFQLRWGGTAAFSMRYILVSLADRGAPPLPDGGAIPAADFSTPVEFDQVLATFGKPVRRELKTFLNNAGTAVGRARPELGHALVKAPPVVDEAASVLAELTGDRDALTGLLRDTDRVVDAVGRSDEELRTLLAGAAETFSAIADNQAGLRGTLRRLPGTLSQARHTLRAADSTLDKAGTLARRIGPGVRQLRLTAGPLSSVLASLEEVAPDARATLRTLRKATPSLNALLERATTVAPQLRSVADGANDNLKCIRPYTPEITALAMTWGDFLSWNDGKDKKIRAQIQNFLPAAYNSVSYTPGEAKKAFPQMRYGFPRPPGYNAGQPWFLPECGAGPDALDPYKDQEAKAPLSAREKAR